MKILSVINIPQNLDQEIGILCLTGAGVEGERLSHEDVHGAAGVDGRQSARGQIQAHVAADPRQPGGRATGAAKMTCSGVRILTFTRNEALIATEESSQPFSTHHVIDKRAYQGQIRPHWQGCIGLATTTTRIRTTAQQSSMGLLCYLFHHV